MQKLLVEDAPVVWLYMHPRLAVAKKGVQGLWKDLPMPVRRSLGGVLGRK